MQVWSHRGRVGPAPVETGRGGPAPVGGGRGGPAPVRGGRDEADNTVAGISAAIASGADGVEFDTWLCTDGEFVCTHDRDSPAGPVDRCRSADLPHLARLEEVLGVAGTATMNVELKVPPDASPEEQSRLGEALCAWLGRYIASVGAAPTPDLVVSSFSASATRPFLGARLPLRLGHLCTEIPDADGLENLARSGYWGVHFLASGVAGGGGAGEVERIRAAGLAAVAWTVNDPQQAARLAGHGAQVIISDVPVVISSSIRPSSRP